MKLHVLLARQVLAVVQGGLKHDELSPPEHGCGRACGIGVPPLGIRQPAAKRAPQDQRRRKRPCSHVPPCAARYRATAAGANSRHGCEATESQIQLVLTPVSLENKETNIESVTTTPTK